MDTVETDELFDAALARFLIERAPAEREPAWSIVDDQGDSWVIRLWVRGEFRGNYLVTAAGSELLP